MGKKVEAMQIAELSILPRQSETKPEKKHFIFLMSVISGEAWRERKHLRGLTRFDSIFMTNA